jgi:hypothetical protein
MATASTWSASSRIDAGAKSGAASYPKAFRPIRLNLRASPYRERVLTRKTVRTDVSFPGVRMTVDAPVKLPAVEVRRS